MFRAILTSCSLADRTMRACSGLGGSSAPPRKQGVWQAARPSVFRALAIQTIRVCSLSADWFEGTGADRKSEKGQAGRDGNLDT